MRLSILVLSATALSFSFSSPSAAAASPTPQQPTATPPAEDLFELGRQLFEQFAPPEIKAEYEFPSKERWDEFAVRLQRALEGDSLQDLAVYLPEARVALTGLRAFPDYGEYADWLEQRIDEIEVANQLGAQPPPAVPPSTPPGPAPSRGRPSTPAPPARIGALPYYDLWVERVRGR